MRILVTGVTGQVGWELVRSCQPLGDVVAADRMRIDLANPDSIRNTLRELRPDIVINPAAYTAVDQAEQDESTAQKINGEAVAVLAAEAAQIGCLLIHYSTDYVFDGTKSSAYIETDLPNPRSAYGRTKLAGEQALLASQGDWLCLRTSWVYASRGKNFMRTILRLASEREELRIVADQLGAPTSARLIADATALIAAHACVERRAGGFTSGIFHLTASGATSWHGFAQAIVDHARRDMGVTSLKAQRITPISTHEYPLPAQRPANSRMACTAIETRFGIQLPAWERGLALCIAECG